MKKQILCLVCLLLPFALTVQICPILKSFTILNVFSLLAYLMIVYGRKNYSGSKFIKCNYVKIDTDEIIDALLTLREAKDDLNVKKT